MSPKRFVMYAISALTLFAAPLFAHASMGTPEAIGFDAHGNLFVAQGAKSGHEGTDNGVSDVVIDGTSTDALTNTYTANGTLSSPVAVAFDPSGNLFVVDSGNDDVVEIATSTDEVMNTYTGMGALDTPVAIAFDRAGNWHCIDKLDTKVDVP